MKYTKRFLLGGKTRLAYTLSVGCALLGAASAQDLTLGEDDAITVYGYKIPEDPNKVGNIITFLDGEELFDGGVRQLDQALKFVPGIISDTSSGQRGSLSSVFMRGNESQYTGYIIDGFRMDNGSIGATFNPGSFIGSGGLNGVSQIEVLKGPQGVFFGASSMAGIVGVSHAKAEGPLSASLSSEYGSFDTFNNNLNIQSSVDGFSFSLSLGSETTDNDLPNNAFESESYAIRVDQEISDNLSVGFTIRDNSSELEIPFYDDHFYALDKNVEFDYSLVTVFGELQVNDIWSTKLTLGQYTQDYASLSSWSTVTGTEKFATYWDNQIEWNESNVTSAGISFEESEYTSTSLLSSHERAQTGLYLNHLIDVTSAWSLSGGLRYTDYDDDALNGFNGDVTTWRVATAYHLDNTDTTFRASSGTGFQLPSFYQVYNISPQNDVDPAESIGFDFSIEQGFNDGQFTVGATYFQTNIEDGIEYLGYTTGAIYGNSEGVTRNYGVEFFAKGSFFDDSLTANLSYTHLFEQALQDPQFLPENSASLRLDYAATEAWNLGLSVTYLGDRALFGNELSGYALVNLYTDYQIHDHVKLNLRVENLFNKEYYYSIAPSWTGGTSISPGRGVGIFGGLTLEW